MSTQARVRASEARLRERGGTIMKVQLQPDAFAIVQRQADAWRRSRQWTINELIRRAATGAKDGG